MPHKDPIEAREYFRRYRKEHADELRAKREANREHAKERDRIWRRANRDKINERKRNYYKDGRGVERLKAYTKEWLKRDPARRAAVKAQWRHSNREKIYQYQAIRNLRIGDGKNDSQVIDFIASIKVNPKTKCFYCNTPLTCETLCIEHIVPLSRGGKHEISNLCASCKKCNSQKHNKMPHEWRREG